MHTGMSPGVLNRELSWFAARSKLAAVCIFCYNAGSWHDWEQEEGMKRPGDNRKRVESVQRELWAALKLAPLIVMLLVVVFVVWHPDLSASAGLFQSGVPTATSEPPTAAPTLTVPATEPPAASATAGPTTPMATTATATPALTPTGSPTALPSATLPATVASTATPSATWTPLPQTATPVPSPTPSGVGQDDQRYAEGESTYRFEWGMLVDSLALAASYLWLCCGVLLFIGVPVVFIVLWVASRRRNQQEE
jgi:hypothetical protein